jgi:predicted lipoprotein with Yx(FWY)xxD motif
MKKLSMLLVAGLLVLAGCGDDESTQPESAGATATTSGATTTAKPKPKPAPARTGTAITVGDSDYGEMLFDSKKQAIYIFQNDPKGKSVCYGECAAAWPPVLTDGQPRAVRGVRESLLGTVKRRDGKLQVTYADKPLYFYANEGPGEVRCHNIHLNGGLWWAVGPNGKRRP